MHVEFWTMNIDIICAHIRGYFLVDVTYQVNGSEDKVLSLEYDDAADFCDSCEDGYQASIETLKLICMQEERKCMTSTTRPTFESSSA